VQVEEEDEDVSPALAAMLAKIRAEKKAKDEAALQKIRDAQVHGFGGSQWWWWWWCVCV
jgi:hypothetical protein